MRVLVAMSGGVDSSVAAYLLKEQGHEVVGMTMRVHDDPERKAALKSCCAPKDIGDARDVASRLGIPFYAVDLRREFKEKVITPFAKSYLSGRTPIPCVLCNSDFKFGYLYQRAKALGFDRVATGHFARIEFDKGMQQYKLFRGKDRSKDQSYFLFGLAQEQLAHTLFPLGEITKGEVRAFAQKAGFRVADKPESQEICFVPDQQYAKVVEETLPVQAQKFKEGIIRDEKGGDLGRHSGIHHFTVGQRKGLKISHTHPLYVLAIDASKNEIVVGPQESLQQRSLRVDEVNWLLDECNRQPDLPLPCQVSIRYRHHPAPATLKAVLPTQAEVIFEQPQKAISPGQAAVFYQGDRVLGGGWIAAS